MEKIKKHHYLLILLVLALASSILAVVWQKEKFRGEEEIFYEQSLMAIEGSIRWEKNLHDLGVRPFPDQYYEPYLAYLAQGQALVEEALQAQGYDELGQFQPDLFQPEKLRQVGQDLVALHEKYMVEEELAPPGELLPVQGEGDGPGLEERDPREIGLPLDPGLVAYIKERNQRTAPLYVGEGQSFSALLSLQGSVVFGPLALMVLVFLAGGIFQPDPAEEALPLGRRPKIQVRLASLLALVGFYFLACLASLLAYALLRGQGLGSLTYPYLKAELSYVGDVMSGVPNVSRTFYQSALQALGRYLGLFLALVLVLSSLVQTVNLVFQGQRLGTGLLALGGFGLLADYLWVGGAYNPLRLYQAFELGPCLVLAGLFLLALLGQLFLPSWRLAGPAPARYRPRALYSWGANVAEARAGAWGLVLAGSLVLALAGLILHGSWEDANRQAILWEKDSLEIISDWIEQDRARLEKSSLEEHLMDLATQEAYVKAYDQRAQEPEAYYQAANRRIQPMKASSGEFAVLEDRMDDRNLQSMTMKIQDLAKKEIPPSTRPYLGDQLADYTAYDAGHYKGGFLAEAQAYLGAGRGEAWDLASQAYNYQYFKFPVLALVLVLLALWPYASRTVKEIQLQVHLPLDRRRLYRKKMLEILGLYSLYYGLIPLPLLFVALVQGGLGPWNFPVIANRLGPAQLLTYGRVLGQAWVLAYGAGLSLVVFYQMVQLNFGRFQAGLSTLILLPLGLLGAYVWPGVLVWPWAYIDALPVVNGFLTVWHQAPWIHFWSGLVLVLVWTLAFYGLGLILFVRRK